MRPLRQGMICLGTWDPAFRDIWFIEGSSTLGSEPQATSNVYVLDEGRVLIDTGNISELAWFIDEEFDVSRVEKVIITHPHFDHTAGLTIILPVANPTIYLHGDALGSAFLGSESLLELARRLGRQDRTVALSDGDIIEAGARRLEVIHTPGHTVGGICLYDRESQSLFSQDLVFPSSGGITYLAYPDDASGSARELLSSLGRLLAYPVENLFPGHFLPSLGGGLEHIKAAYRQLVKTLVQDARRKEEESWVKLAAALADHGRLEEALECYEEALRVNPRHMSAYLSKGLVLTELGSFEEALEIFREILKVKPDAEEASIGMGFCLLGLGRLEEAMAIEVFRAKIEGL
jgi:glyoxylase-like metal-dependent hydrolase (beta-lactamase superfamily II)